MQSLGPVALGILAEGRQLYIAVAADSGPHLTPELYAESGGDIWFATAASTLKVRVLRSRPDVCALVRVGSRSVVVRGRTQSYDVADPKALAGQVLDAWSALQATAAFALRNAADLGAFARDLVRGRLPSRRPPRRVLVRLRPEAVAVLDGAAVEWADGGWAQPAELTGGGAALSGGREAVLAWEHGDRLLALPARAPDDLTVAQVPAALARLEGVVDGAQARVALVVDDYNAPGPAAKAGLLVRGTGRISYDGDVARIDVEAARQTTWDGVETHSRAV